jgi:hypothetical protein
VRLVLYLFCLVFGVQAINAQVYSYRFIQGWTALRAIDSSLIVGLSTDSQNGYSIVLSRVEFSSQFKEYRPQNSFSISLLSAFGIYNYNQSNVVTGHYINSDTDRIATVLEFDENLEIVNKIDYSGDEINYSVLSIPHNGGFYHLGQQKSKDPANRYKLFFSKYDDTGSQLFSKTYECGGISVGGGCTMETSNMIMEDSNSFILAAVGSAHYIPYTNIKNGLIIKVDSMGKEQWRLAIENDSTTCHNLLIAPLANGNFLATWQDAYYKPFKASGGTNPFPLGSVNVTTWLMEFTADGEIIKTSNLRKHLKHKFWNTPQPNFHNHLITTEDSSIILVGNASNRGTNGYDLGYALKLDKNGNYLWYRQYELDVDKPHGTGQEKLYINGVTQLSTGGYALAGEYRSDPSDSFPNGTQRGVVLFVDEYGCLEPGCQLTDGVAELQTKQAVFRVYPNPSSGQIEVRSERLDIRLKKIEVFDMQGMLVYSQSSTSNSLTSTISHLSSNLYYLKIYRDDGLFEVHKVILR